MEPDPTAIKLDGELLDRTRELRVDVVRAARQGVADAIENAENDRAAYLRHPEQVDPFWQAAQRWSDA